MKSVKNTLLIFPVKLLFCVPGVCYLLEASSIDIAWCLSAALGFLPLNCLHSVVPLPQREDDQKEKEIAHSHIGVMSNVFALLALEIELEIFTL